MNLFDDAIQKAEPAPLSERLRPRTFAEV